MDRGKDLHGAALNNDLFVDSKFSCLSDDGDTNGGAGGRKGKSGIFLLALRSQIHCQPEALKEFLKKGPEMKSKKDKAVKFGEGEVYDMTYRVSTRTARYEVRQEHSWGDGKAIGSEAEFVLLASAKEGEGVAAAASVLGGVSSIQGKRRKRDAVKEAAKGVINRAVTKEKVPKTQRRVCFVWSALLSRPSRSSSQLLTEPQTYACRAGSKAQR